jgi:parallel beta-helix repeat protein
MVILMAIAGASIFNHRSSFASTPAIPDTNYAVPAGAIFMATTGSDANAGTQAAPVKTLNAAVSKVTTGGTIVVRAGSYRDYYNDGAGNYATLNKSLTIQPYPHEQVWFDGTDVVGTGWSSDGSGHFTHTWSTPSFCGKHYYDRAWDAQDATASNSGPCTHNDMQNGTAGDPQMAWVNGTELTEVSSLAAVTATSFYYAEDLANKTGTMYIGSDPAGKTIELAARPMAIYVNSASTTVRGLGFRRYATNEYSGYATAAAVLTGGANAVVENNVFTENAAAGYTNIGTGLVMRGNLLTANGFNGSGGNGHASSGGTDNLLAEDNTFSYNNKLNFGTGCSASCAQAGWKTAHLVGAVIRNNVFAGNTGHGFWCDLDCSGVQFTGNVVHNNTKEGIFYEVSGGGIIASNLVYNNGKGMSVGSGTTKIYNNTLIGNGSGIVVYDDSRAPTTGQVAADTTDDYVINNIVSSTNAADRCSRTTLLTVCDAGQTTAQQMLPGANNLDYNLYLRPGSTPTHLLSWDTAKSATSSYDSVAAVRSALGRELHSLDSTAALTAVFVNAAGGDYTLASSSPAKGAGAPLPADVAAAIGVTPGATVNMGALVWAGSSSPASATGDLNSDGSVNIFDLSMLLSSWGTATSSRDINGDGTVNVFDLSIMLSHWGA